MQVEMARRATQAVEERLETCREEGRAKLAEAREEWRLREQRYDVEMRRAQVSVTTTLPRHTTSLTRRRDAARAGASRPPRLGGGHDRRGGHPWASSDGYGLGAVKKKGKSQRRTSIPARGH